MSRPAWAPAHSAAFLARLPVPTSAPDCAQPAVAPRVTPAVDDGVSSGRGPVRPPGVHRLAPETGRSLTPEQLFQAAREDRFTPPEDWP